MTALGIPFRLNPRLVRGLVSYSHTAFEITSDQRGAQATVCGGGRYYGLIGQLGGAPTPAIGWALGIERLLLVLEAAAKADPQGVATRLTAGASPDVYVVNRGGEAGRGEVRLKPLQQQGEEYAGALTPVAAIVEGLLTP